MLKGYMGKIGWVDLTAGTSAVTALDEVVARKYLGGKGLGAYLLYKNFKPGTPPLDPGNILIIVTGPLTGTQFPAASRSGVITRSPLTGTFLDTYSGGRFGAQLKWAGFDALVVSGKAEKSCYLMVEPGGISIQPAGDLWGLTTGETERRLKERYASGGKDKISVAAIGPAGENGALFASIINERRAHGRGGSGAVMGSKNLKAIVVRGDLKVAMADEEGFKETVRRCRQQIAENRLVGKGGAFTKVGTMSTIGLTNETGTLPALNWRENTYEPAGKVGASAFLNYAGQQRACYACPIGCSRDTTASVGGKEYVTEGPDYETMFAFGPICGIEDPRVIIASDQLCDEYGLDTISCGGVIGFAMECFEKGLIGLGETGGIDLKFGNGDAIIQLIPMIARREGFGARLADGSKRLAETIPGSSDFAMQVKGLELPGYDPRGMKGQALTYALSDRGGCHVRSNTLRTELIGRPKSYDRFSYDDKSEMIRDLQLDFALMDCLIACVFGNFAITQPDYAEAVARMTGWDFTQDELLKIAERTWNLTRLFNLREGFGRKDDTLPARLFKQPSTAGPSQGQVVDPEKFEKMLTDYYEFVGWNPVDGSPTEQKLKELNLIEI